MIDDDLIDTLKGAGYSEIERDESRMACMGAPTIEDGDMRECTLCGTKVRWDLVDHPLFGFKACKP